jgi:hypothetical protein
MKLDPRALLAIAVIVIIGASAYTIGFEAGLPYGGGGEVGSSLSTVTVDGTTWGIYGQHSWPSDERSDLDGDFEDVADWKWGMDYSDVQKPGVSIESSYPYYLEELAKNIFVEADEASITREYTKTYTLHGEPHTYQYNLIPYGVDVTIKTDADRFYGELDVFSYFGWFYGWYHEDKPVDVDLLLNFGLNPWVPKGLYIIGNESYSIVDGWAGILQAEVYDIDYGVLENERLEQELEDLNEGARYDSATTIQDLNSINSALNMYIPGTKDSYQEIDFDDPDEIVGVRNAVNIEVGAKLGAGSTYTADILGHKNSIAVRNVYVTYKLVVKIVTTLDLELITEGSGIEPPEEGSTGGDPPPVPIYSSFAAAWSEFWADVGEFFSSPIVIIYTILILVIIAGVVYFIVKLRFGRGG